MRLCQRGESQSRAGGRRSQMMLLVGLGSGEWGQCSRKQHWRLSGQQGMSTSTSLTQGQRPHVRTPFSDLGGPSERFPSQKVTVFSEGS